MALQITCNPYYVKVGNRVIDKITDDFNPPRYWFRLKIKAVGRAHKGVSGQIHDFWWGDFRRVKDFDPINFLWLSEPIQLEDAGQVVAQYFKPDIPKGRYELAGLLHAKMPMKPVDPKIPLPKDNIPDEQLPEVELNQSLIEPRHVRKRRNFKYGIYYLRVMVTDNEGNIAKKSFKIWAYRDPKKCKIRTTRFYERVMLFLKAALPAI